jgi:hypothetical protein
VETLNDFNPTSTRSQDDSAVDAIVVGRFASGNLDTSVPNRGYAGGTG